MMKIKMCIRDRHKRRGGFDKRIADYFGPVLICQRHAQRDKQHAEEQAVAGREHQQKVRVD